jgi:hypothetical protein
MNSQADARRNAKTPAQTATQRAGIGHTRNLLFRRYLEQDSGKTSSRKMFE